MKLKLKYKDSDNNLIEGKNCSQTLELNNLLERDANNNIMFYNQEIKYNSQINGNGPLPEIDKSQILQVECEIRIYNKITNTRYQPAHNAAKNSIFFKPDIGELIPLNSYEQLQNLGSGEVSYRPILNMVISKISINSDNFKPKWTIYLEEA